EGLLLGVWASCMFYTKPDVWAKIRNACSYLWLPSLLAFAGVAFLDPSARYVYGYSLIAIIFTIVLIHVVERRSLVNHWITYNIARSSYSLYLVHAFTIAASLAILSR